MTPKCWFSLPLLVGLLGCGTPQQPLVPKAESATAPLVAQPGSTDHPEARQSVPQEPRVANIEKFEAKYLPNPVRVHENVISGGLPEGDAAFAELQQLGIKTVISVDGAKPDVATAERYGMRYVHLPHGYDGVPEARAKQLAKAVHELPGPIYIHCHHGKHRSPAATAVACVGAGLITVEDAPKVLRIAGTSEAYRGLFQSVADAYPFEMEFLDAFEAEFPSVAKLPAMAEAMVEIEHVHDRLKAIEKAGWKTPPDMPALVPDHEALLLREQFTEVLRTKELQERPKAFQQLAREAEAASQALEDSLKSPPTNAESASKLFLAVSNNCKACHQTFRDVPLKDKPSN